MSDKSKVIVIKRGKKGHAAHHGGSWKVAYADFVTAMMAFFLLMWLLSMSSDQKRASLSQYFKRFSIFEQPGTSFLAQNSNVKAESGGDVTEDKRSSKGAIEVRAEDLQEKLRKGVHNRLKDMEDRIAIDIAKDGVRIQITDPDGTMFPPGSSQPTAKAREILRVVSDNIKDMPNMIAVEGHTDASGYRAGKSTNWELSSARASAARYELEVGGISPQRVARVVGFADKNLFIPDDPKNPRNRRISILIMPARIKREGVFSEENKPGPQPDAVKIIEPRLKSGEKLPQSGIPEKEPVTIKKERETGIVNTEKKPALQERPGKEVVDMGIKPKKPIEFESPIMSRPAGPAAKKQSTPLSEPRIIAPKLKPGEKPPQPPIPEKKPVIQERPGKEVVDMGIKPKKPIEFESPIMKK